MLKISFKFKLCLFIRMNLILAVNRLQYAHNNPQYQDVVEFNGAVAVRTTTNLIKCAKECIENDKCVTLFYNHISGLCVIHSTDFKFQTPSVTQLGWKHYIIRDDTGRCPPPYHYYRYLDFCYYIGVVNRLHFQEIKQICNETGGRLAAIESEQKGNYFEQILADRPHMRVAVAGYRTSVNNWTLDDGTLLTYFNWYPGEPSSTFAKCLELVYQVFLYDCACILNHPAEYICEI